MVGEARPCLIDSRPSRKEWLLIKFHLDGNRVYKDLSAFLPF
jgi:hypothetical protein